MSKVSVIIPSRNEPFVSRTVQDLLAHAVGDIECIVVADGSWPNPPLPDDPRVKVLHRGTALGMRPAINDAIRCLATGEYIFKVDAHVSVQTGFDEVLKADCDDDWIVIPRRDRLDAEKWCRHEVGKPPIDAHYLSNPIERLGDSSCGLHGTIWDKRARERRHILIDEELSTQGSAWFTKRTFWDRTIGPMDSKSYGAFINEAQEFGCKAWLSGGRMMVNKNTTYLHLHKGKRWGRFYNLRGLGHELGAVFASWYWMTDQWPQRQHDLLWLIKRFWPVPTWGDDPERVFHEARRVLRNPYERAA